MKGLSTMQNRFQNGDSVLTIVVSTSGLCVAAHRGFSRQQSRRLNSGRAALSWNASDRAAAVGPQPWRWPGTAAPLSTAGA